MLTRKEVKKLWLEIQDTNEDLKITEEYIDALRNYDIDKLEWFNSFGPSVRHRIMNVNEYRHGLRFGFNLRELGEYGWLIKATWQKKEELSLKIDSDGANYNRIKLAQGPNGRWTYGLSYNIGTSGGGWGPSVFDTPYNSKEDCQKAALNYFHGKLINGKDTSRPQKTRAYADKLMAIVNSQLAALQTPQQLQLALF